MNLSHKGTSGAFKAQPLRGVDAAATCSEFGDTARIKVRIVERLGR
jgi:hypothetical protein